MAKDIFKFKYFSVKQDVAAMKVGTDGVLLGAWAAGGDRILDVGTGTGLIAMMISQRFPNALVDAVDITEEACAQAVENVSVNDFNNINVECVALQNFFPEVLYNSIISNPPYFIDSLKSPDLLRQSARHTDTLSYRELFDGVVRLLEDDGEFSAIIPADYAERFIAESALHGMFIKRRIDVKTVERKQPKRVLLSFSKQQPCEFENSVQVMQTNDGKYSCWYENLTSEFYL